MPDTDMLFRLSLPRNTVAGIVATGLLVLAVVPANAADIGVLTFSSAQLQAAAPAGIPVSSFSFSANIGSASTGAGAGRAADKQLIVTISKPSPVLFQMASNGSHIAAMKLVANGQTLTFKDVAIVRVTESSGGARVSETVVFAFQAMEDSNATPVPMIDHAIKPMLIDRPPAMPTPTKSP
jgi:hypothetical protein